MSKTNKDSDVFFFIVNIWFIEAIEMIKKIVPVLIVCLLCNITGVHGQQTDVTPNAGSAMLIEASSRQVLYQKNQQEKLYPASTTKIMTMILLFESIHNKELTWEDTITTSTYAASMGGSQVYLEVGEKMSVKDMFKSIAIASANDASVAVAEKIAGSIEKFVEMMNAKSKVLGLTNTHFKNATGLHDDGHYTCAQDLALMAAYLIEIGGKELFDVTSLYDSYIRENSKQSFWLVNTNKLLKLYDGVDGLKTGFTKEAGYCLVTTANKDGLRLIGVVMNEKEPKVRNEEMCAMLDYGYASYKLVTLYKKEETIDNLEINNSEKKSIKIACTKDVVYIQGKNKEKEVRHEIVYSKTLPPIQEGEKVGKLNLFLDDKQVASYDLYSQEEVGMLNFYQKSTDVFKLLF